MHFDYIIVFIKLMEIMNVLKKISTDKFVPQTVTLTVAPDQYSISLNTLKAIA